MRGSTLFVFCVATYSLTLATNFGSPLDTTSPIASSKPSNIAPNKEAYVTILYKAENDETYQEGFEIGVRVLGQSLRESETTKEYIALCTQDVPEATRKVLSTDGWTVRTIEGFEKGETKHFNGFILKLHAWLLEEYRRIVYLDSDTLVVRNVDELFRCGTFCATYRHSDLFNAGVMVLQPSITHHKNLKQSPCPLKKKCGDQVLLNIYFSDLKYVNAFNESDPKYHEQPLRLPWKYNADVGMYYLNAHWSIPEDTIKIIHYTMGPLKPMQWWTYLVLDQNWKWNSYRERLPFIFNEPSMYRLFNLIPFAVLLSLYLLIKLGYFQYIFQILLSYSFAQKMTVLFVPGENGWFASFFPIVSQTVAYIAAFYCVPTSMRPKEAWMIYGMWVIFFIVLQYMVYCSYLFIAIEYTSIILPMRRRVKSETALYVAFFVILYVIQVYVPYILTFSVPFYHRLLLVIFLALVGYVYGYFAGRHLLKLWMSYRCLPIIH